MAPEKHPLRQCVKFYDDESHPSAGKKKIICFACFMNALFMIMLGFGMPLVILFAGNPTGEFTLSFGQSLVKSYVLIVYSVAIFYGAAYCFIKDLPEACATCREKNGLLLSCELSPRTHASEDIEKARTYIKNFIDIFHSYGLSAERVARETGANLEAVKAVFHDLRLDEFPFAKLVKKGAETVIRRDYLTGPLPPKPEMKKILE